MRQNNKKYSKPKHFKLTMFSRKITKLFLNLVILAGLGMLIRHGYLLFTHKTDPVMNSIIFIVGIVAWILLIRFLRSRYKRTSPSFKLTTFSVVAVLLILTFAGIQPLAGYKDNLIESYKAAQAERAAQEEVAAAARAKQEAAEAVAKAEAEAQELLKLEKATFDLINLERENAGLYPIVWNDDIHDRARRHSEAMQAKGSLYHDTGGMCWECIYGASWSRYGTSRETVDAWMLSSGHRAILLGTYSIGAIGIAKDDGFFATYKCR